MSNVKHKVDHCAIDDMFKTESARIVPFLISEARKMICEICFPHRRDVIKRIQTDGFI